jgi:hypothetical protein
MAEEIVIFNIHGTLADIYDPVHRHGDSQIETIKTPCLRVSVVSPCVFYRM